MLGELASGDTSGGIYCTCTSSYFPLLTGLEILYILGAPLRAKKNSGAKKNKKEGNEKRRKREKRKERRKGVKRKERRKREKRKERRKKKPKRG